MRSPALLIGLALVPGLGCRRAPVSPVEPLVGVVDVEVSPRLPGPQVVVPVHLNTAGLHELRVGLPDGSEARFLLDTGAATTVIDVGLARRLELSVGSSGSAFGLGGAVSAQLADDLVFTLGGTDLPARDVGVIDLAPINDVLGTALVPPVQGILGLDVLRDHGAVLDVGRQELRLSVEPE